MLIMALDHIDHDHVDHVTCMLEMTFDHVDNDIRSC